MRSLLALTLAAAAVLGAERTEVAVKLEPCRTAEALPRVDFPQTRFFLTAKRPNGLDGVPALSKQARYATVRLGRSVVPVAFEVPEGASALGILHAAGAEPAPGKARRTKDGFRVDFEDVACGGLRLNVGLVYRGGADPSGVAELSRHRRGRVLCEGELREVVLVDGDADGKFDGDADRWVTLRTSRATRTDSLRRVEGLLLGEPQVPFQADGRAFMVERVAEDGSSLVLVLDVPRVKAEAVLDRREAEVRAQHFATFKSEAKDFALRMELDTTRQRVGQAPAWRRTTLEEARRVAAKERRPILAFFVAESNAWCYRYDFYTFPDREVAALLERFVRVRIDVEKDGDQDYRESGARGLPALVPLTPEGDPVSFRLLNRAPDGTIADLESPEHAITGWQRPEELAVNLGRVLEAMGKGGRKGQ